MLQGSLLTFGDPAVADAEPERIDLDARSWVDVTRGLVIGADEILSELIETVEWRCQRRRMYDREVDDPRLSRWWKHADDAPHPVLLAVRAAIERRYAIGLGGLGLNFYRDGSDSVAFHRDRVLRERPDSLVAILTMGAQRPFRIRPHGGGPSIDLAPASGDLLVMGGRAQLDWEHGVPKVARAVGPRVSASWRWSTPTPTPHGLS